MSQGGGTQMCQMMLTGLVRGRGTAEKDLELFL